MKSLIAFTSLVLSTQVFAKDLDQVMREKNNRLESRNSFFTGEVAFNKDELEKIGKCSGSLKLRSFKKVNGEVPFYKSDRASYDTNCADGSLESLVAFDSDLLSDVYDDPRLIGLDEKESNRFDSDLDKLLDYHKFSFELPDCSFYVRGVWTAKGDDNSGRVVYCFYYEGSSLKFTGLIWNPGIYGDELEDSQIFAIEQASGKRISELSKDEVAEWLKFTMPEEFGHWNGTIDR